MKLTLLAITLALVAGCVNSDTPPNRDEALKEFWSCTESPKKDTRCFLGMGACAKYTRNERVWGEGKRGGPCASSDVYYTAWVCDPEGEICIAAFANGADCIVWEAILNANDLNVVTPCTYQEAADTYLKETENNKHVHHY